MYIVLTAVEEILVQIVTALQTLWQHAHRHETQTDNKADEVRLTFIADESPGGAVDMQANIEAWRLGLKAESEQESTMQKVRVGRKRGKL